MSAPGNFSKTLKSLQKQSFDYFIHEVNPINGLTADKTQPGAPASIAAVGLALAAYPVGVENGFMSRLEARRRTLSALRFFRHSSQSTAPSATGYKGFYYHFLDMSTGARVWNCELSTVDTAFLIAGMLTAAAYFRNDTPGDVEIRELAEELYCRVDWNWARNGFGTVCMGWTPEAGFLPNNWGGYDEALLLYVLGFGSPTYPLPTGSYEDWTRTYEWIQAYGIDYLYSAPLFTHQLSHLWIDFRAIQDEFMRGKGIDYFVNSRRATQVQQLYAIDNPKNFEQYGTNCWGITASDGPGPKRMNVKGRNIKFYDYLARGVPYGPDDGTLAPWAVAASLPFAPEIVVPAIEHYIHNLKLIDENPYGFKATFNPTFPVRPASANGWVSPWHVGINEGPVVLMIENFKSEMLWKMMGECRYIVDGLKRAGFTGGWLGG